MARGTMSAPRVALSSFRSNKLTGMKVGNIMSGKQFEDRAPAAPRLTAYDEDHLEDYLRLLDEDDAGADWPDVAALVFGIDPAAEPDRAKAMHASHLARARWMTEVGYAYLLGPRATE